MSEPASDWCENVVRVPGVDAMISDRSSYDTEGISVLLRVLCIIPGWRYQHASMRAVHARTEEASQDGPPQCMGISGDSKALLLKLLVKAG